mmetsp:Transcript_23706/g.59755  ORF Transcript_23706/g.59755 Transcript_23706/m.59755 type:complete len:117 (+) Transcript_23706:75-425(+)
MGDELSVDELDARLLSLFDHAAYVNVVVITAGGEQYELKLPYFCRVSQLRKEVQSAVASRHQWKDIAWRRVWKRLELNVNGKDISSTPHLSIREAGLKNNSRVVLRSKPRQGKGKM